MRIKAFTLGTWAASGLVGTSTYYKYWDDPYWENVSLLLHGEDLTDSSTYLHVNNAINLATNSSDLCKFGSKSMYLSYSSSYIRYKTVSELKMESDDFTIEFWINPSNLSANGIVLSNGEKAATSTPNYRVELKTTGIIRFLFGHSYQYYGSIIGDFSSTATITIGSWSHVAVSKSGTNYLIFINGILDATATYSSAPDDTTTTTYFCIGNNTVVQSFVGYLDDLRITKGICRYLTDFTPPTRAYPDPYDNNYTTTFDQYYNNVSLFLQDSLVDSSIKEQSFTNTGVTIDNTTVLVGENSLVFDGLTYLTGTTSNVAFGTDSFTIEMIIKPSNVTMIGQQGLFDSRSAGNSTGVSMNISPTGYIEIGRYAASPYYLGSTTLSPIESGKVYHLACVYNSATSLFELYINGVQKISVSIAATSQTNTTYWLGKCYDVDDYHYQGLMNNVRITKGVARYTANFNPPLESMYNSTMGDPYWDNVALLINGNSEYYDQSSSETEVLKYGTPTVGTICKYNAKSLSFPGSKPNYYYVNSSNIILSSSLDFTLETWLYRTGNYDADSGIFDFRDTTTTGSTFFIDGPTNKLAVWNSNLSVKSGATGDTIELNTWYHVALSRNGTTTRCFLNGVLQWLTTNAMFDNSTILGIGGADIYFAGQGYGTSPFMGYFDDYRITKGIARYVTNFTPPTRTLPVMQGGDKYHDYVPLIIGPKYKDAYSSSDALTDVTGLHTITNAGLICDLDDVPYEGAVAFTGTGASTNYATIPSSSDLQFTTDCTIDFWYKFPSTSTQAVVYLLTKRGTSAVNIGVDFEYPENAFHFIFWSSGGATLGALITDSILLDTWNHVRLVKKGLVLYSAINGVFSSTTATLTANCTSSTNVLDIGRNQGNSSRYLVGSLADLRVTNYAKEICNFTPPTHIPVAQKAKLNWTPMNITPKLWLSSTNSITDSSGYCSSWEDKSQNTYPYTQSTASYRPLINYLSKNNLPSLTFDGSNDYIVGDSRILGALNAASYAYAFAVFKTGTTDTAVTERAILTFSTAINVNRFSLFASHASVKNRYAIGGRRLDGDSYYTCISDTERSQEWDMILGIMDYTNRTMSLYVNGVLDKQVTSAFTASGTTSATNSTYSRVGAGSASTLSSWFNGDIADVVFGTTALTSDDIDKLFGYAAHKYALTGNLLSTHPYKKEPPTT